MKKDDCPRGFHFCDIKKECVPDRAEAKDKLMQRNQRYFFKEDIDMDKLTKAEQLLDIALDEGFETFSKIKSAEKKLDELLSECGGCGGMGGHRMTPEEYADHEREEHGEDDPEDVQAYTQAYYGDGYDDEEADEEMYEDFDAEYEQQPSNGPNDINTIPNQDADGLLNSIQKQIGEWKKLDENDREAYKKFFDGMLKKYGVTSPSQLDPQKKKEFFNAVDKGWTK